MEKKNCKKRGTPGNEGISREVYENKGREKLALVSLQKLMKNKVLMSLV
jgi:hypothetical protein